MVVPELHQLTIRAWTGGYDEDEYPDLYLAYGDGHLVAQHVLRERLAEITHGPAQAGTDGDYSENWQYTIDSLENQLKRLEQVIDNLGLDASTSRPTLTAHRMTRAGVRVRTP